MRWRSAFLVLLILHTAFAAGTDLTLLVPGVAVLSIIFLALVNMLASAISNPQLEAWGKTELRELVAGIILIVIIIAFFIASQSVSATLSGQSNPVQKSITVLDTWVDKLISSYDDVIEAAGRIRVAATYSSGTNIPIYWVSINYQTSPLGGAAIFLVPLSLATQGLTNAIFLCEAMRVLLAFSEIVMPKILLPIAFCLRLIPFTRRIGNTLIALSLGVMVFFPLSVIITDSLNSQIGLPDPHIADMGALDSNPFPIFVFGPICEFAFFRFFLSMTDPLFSAIVCLPVAWIPGAFSICFETVWKVVYPIISMVFQYVNAAFMLPWEAAINPSVYGGAVYSQLQPFLRDVSNLVMVIYLDMVMITMITMAGARGLSTALGGEWYMAGVQRLI